MKERNPEQGKERGKEPAKEQAKEQAKASRRGFLRQAGQAGFLAGAAALGAAGAKRESDTPAPSAPEEAKRGYHESEHIRQYYRTSGVF